MLESLKEEIYAAVIYLKEQKMRALGKGNISLLDRTNNLIVTEPASMALVTDAGSMLVCDLAGNIVEGNGEVHKNLATHIEIYRAFPQATSVVHSHSLYATAWAQAGRDIPVYGTSHADAFGEAVPCSRDITMQEAEENYAAAAGSVVVEAVLKRGVDPSSLSAALLFQHGAFCWGVGCMEAANRAVALEQIAMLAYLTEKINPDVIGTKRNITRR